MQPNTTIDAGDEDEVEQARRAARCRVALFTVFVSLGLLLMLSPSRWDTDPDTSSGSGSGGGSDRMEGALDHALSASSDGFVFPSGLPERELLTGTWNRQDGYSNASVFPALSHNLSVEFRVQHGLPPVAAHGFVHSSGYAALNLRSGALYTTETQQRFLGGFMVLTEPGASSSPSSPSRLLFLNVTGNYYPDLGMVVLIASDRPASAAVVLPSPAMVSPTASQSPTPASASSSPSPSASAAAAAAAAGRRLLLNGGMSTPALALGAARIAAAAVTSVGQPAGVCTYAIVMRTRPIGVFDEGDAEQPPRTRARVLREAAAVTAVSAGTGGDPRVSFDDVSARGEETGATRRVHAGGLSANAGQSIGRTFGGKSPRSFIIHSLSWLSSGWGGASSTKAREAVPLPGAATVSSSGLSAPATAAVDSGWLNNWEHEASADLPPMWSTPVFPYDAEEEVEGAEDDIGHAHRRLAGAAAGAASASSAAHAHPTYGGAMHIPMYGTAVSWNCNTTFNLTFPLYHINGELLEAKVGAYALMATNQFVVLIVALAVQLVRASSVSAYTRISITAMGLQTVLNALLCMTHLMLMMMRPSLFMSFWMAVVFSLIMFSMLEMKLLFMLYKAHYPERFAEGSIAARRVMLGIYTRFYITIAAAITLVVVFDTWGLRALTVILLSYWVPQIIHSARRDSRPPFVRSYVVLTTIANLAIPLYFIACPSNWDAFVTPSESVDAVTAWAAARAGDVSSPPPEWRNAPWMIPPDAKPSLLTPEGVAAYASRLRFAEGLILWSLIQMAVVLLQGKSGWGPRFFVPYAFLPPRYNYHRRVVVVDGRVEPDPAATAPWMHPTATTSSGSAAQAPAAAAAAGATAAVAVEMTVRTPGAAAAAATNGGAAAAAAGTPATPGSALLSPTELLSEGVAFISHSVRGMRNWVLGNVRSTVEVTTWFASGCAILARDGYAWARHLFVKETGGGSGASSGGRGRESRNSDDAGGVVSGAPGTHPSPPLRPSSLLSPPPSTSTRTGGGSSAWSGLTGHGGAAAAGRYARLDTINEADEEANGLSHGGSGGGGVNLTVHAPSAASDEEAAESSHSRGTAAPSSLPSPLVGNSANTIDCVVCMGELTFPLSRWEYMVTPCDHIFHTACLRPWLEQKLECPSCRVSLPEPYATTESEPDAAAAAAATATAAQEVSGGAGAPTTQ